MRKNHLSKPLPRALNGAGFSHPYTHLHTMEKNDEVFVWKVYTPICPTLPSTGSEKT